MAKRGTSPGTTCYLSISKVPIFWCSKVIMVDPVVGGQQDAEFGFKGHRINTENPQQMMLSANFWEEATDCWKHPGL